MALFRKFFYRKPPDGLLEISERVYVFDSCFTTDVLEEDEYKIYMGGIVSQVRDHFPDASFMVFNFREGEKESQIFNILSEYDMTVMDYPRHYESCPLLTMEMIHIFLRSSESWLSLGQQNVLLMHCERGGWPVLAFMLAALLIYRKQYTGEQKTLDMIYKQAPRELLQLMSPLNPMPSQLRYLQYVSRRNVGSVWPPLDRALTLDCIILRIIPNNDGEGGCRPIFRIYGQDPFMAADRTPKVLFSTPKRSKTVRYYKQADCELVKIDIHCHIQGDVVLECISLADDLEREEMMFRVMFNTAFIRSNILILNRDEIDVLWDAKDQFPKDFRAEVLFSEMDSAPPPFIIEYPGIELKEGLPMEAFDKVQEIFSSVDWLDPKTDLALNVLHKITASTLLHERLETDSPTSAETGSTLQESICAKVEPKASKNDIRSPTSTDLRKQSVPSVKPSPEADSKRIKVESQELPVAVQHPKIMPQRIHQRSNSNPVSYSNSLQGSLVPHSRYRSAPSSLGITALLHDHASSKSEEVTRPVTISPPSSAPISLLPKPVQPIVVSVPPPPPLTLPSLQPLQEASKPMQKTAATSQTPDRPLSLKESYSVLTKHSETFLQGRDQSSLVPTFPPPPPPPPPPPSLSGASPSLSRKNSSSYSSFPPTAPSFSAVPSSPISKNLFSTPASLPTSPSFSSVSPSFSVKNLVPPPPPQPPFSSEVSISPTIKESFPVPPPLPPSSLPDFASSATHVVSSLLPIKPTVMAGPPPPPPPPSRFGVAPGFSAASSAPPPPPLPSRPGVASCPSVVSSAPPPPPPPSRIGVASGPSVVSSAPPPPPPPSWPGVASSSFVVSSAPLPPPPPSRSGAGPSVVSSTPPPPPPPISGATSALSVVSFAPPPPPPPSRSMVASGPSAPPPPPPPSLAPKDSVSKNSPPVPPPPAPFTKGLSKSGGSLPQSHSVGSNGSVPPSPAPPFIAKGRIPSRTSPRNQSQTKKASLKPYHWLKLTRAMQGSLWAETQKSDDASKAPEFDMSELESLFSAAVPGSDGGTGGKSNRRASGPKSDKVQLIELRRAYNCEIMLTKVKIPLPDLMSSVLALDDTALDVDQVDNLIKFCPTKEEMELLKGYNGDKENLGKCEQFFLELMKVPRVESKLRVFSFKIQFRSQVSDLRNSLNVVNSVAEEIRNSAKLKRIMQTILSLGNALNHGTARGSAIGFRLDSLLKLTDTRARNNKMTLMHYLCKVLAEKLPELLDFQKDLVSLEGSTKIQLKFLAEEMQAISKGLEKVVQELTASENDGRVSENFCKTLKEFLGFAEAEVRSLASLYSGVGRNADALALYFGEDPARCPFEQVVSTLLNFVRMFVRAHEENCKQLELEKKKAQKEAENEKKLSAPKKESDNSTEYGKKKSHEKMKTGIPRKESDHMTQTPIKSGNAI